MRKLLIAITFFSSLPGVQAQEVRIEKASAGSQNMHDMFGWEVRHDGQFAFVSAPHEDGHDTNTGAVYVYRLTGAHPEFAQRLQPPGAQAFCMFGMQMAQSGNYLLVSSLLTISTPIGTGNIFLYHNNNGTWELVSVPGLELSEGAPTSISMSDNRIAVGYGFVHRTHPNGFVKLFSIDTTSHEVTLSQKITSQEEHAPLTVIGHDVSLHHDALVFSSIAADGSAQKSGAVWLYRFRNGEWVYQTKIAHDNANTFDHFGYSLAIDYPYLAIGAPRYITDDGKKSGGVFVYQMTDTGSELETLLTSDDAGDHYDYFGSSVDLHRGTLVVGAHADDFAGENAGAVYLFQRLDGTWKKLNKLAGSKVSDDAAFGASVSLHHNTILVSSHMEESDQSSTDHGAVYFYRNNDIILSAEEDTQNAFSPISVYPNPFRESFFLSLNKVKNIESVVITDILGRIVHSIDASKLRTDSKLEVSSRFGPAGIYIVRAKYKNTTYTSRIVKY